MRNAEKENCLIFHSSISHHFGYVVFLLPRLTIKIKREEKRNHTASQALDLFSHPKYHFFPFLTHARDHHPFFSFSHQVLPNGAVNKLKQVNFSSHAKQNWQFKSSINRGKAWRKQKSISLYDKIILSGKISSHWTKEELKTTYHGLIMAEKSVREVGSNIVTPLNIVIVLVCGHAQNLTNRSYVNV